MVVDRASRDEEPVGDVRVPAAVGDEAKDIHLTRRQLRPVGAGGHPGAARDACPALAQPPRHYRRRGTRPELSQPLERSPAGVLVIHLPERERRLVGAAELPPRRPPPRASVR